MDEDLKRVFWLGYMRGILNGIRMRPGTSPDMKELINGVLADYDKAFADQSPKGE